MELLTNLFVRVVTTVVLCLSLLTSAVLAIGLDGTFASGGKFTTSFADTGDPSASASRVFVQPSGRIVVVGRHQAQGTNGRMNGIAMAGLTVGGTLDGTFGGGGKVLIWSPIGNSNLADVLMLADGSFILLYQYLQAPNTQLPVLVKYTPNGQPDGAFTADPRISPTTPTTQSIKLAQGANSKIYALVGQGPEHFLIRFNSDGSRDGTFAANGFRNINLKRIPTSQRSISGLHELEGGKIVVFGNYEAAITFYYNGFVIRFDSDTNIDRTFGRQGVFHVALPFGSVGFTSSVAQADGKLLLGGYFTFLGSNALMVRLTARGRYDASFGNAGVLMTSFNSINVIYGIALAPDGKIFIAGTSSEKAFPPNQRLSVARFSASGVREEWLLTNFVSNLEAGGNAIARQSDGKLVVGGFSQNPTGFFSQLGAARFTP
jgi:uncharacterized delta-60 repeat protein